ncbi:MAG: hypothetical protein JXR60_04860 [Bacteroidales bacterium]|nr:hypothetical protein [Bacteroidales bacterium]
MATKRNVKKDIEYVTYTIVHDCMLHLEYGHDERHDEVLGLISRSLQKRNELFDKVNQQTKAPRSATRAYYREIYKELTENADQAFEKLSKLIIKK